MKFIETLNLYPSRDGVSLAVVWLTCSVGSPYINLQLCPPPGCGLSLGQHGKETRNTSSWSVDRTKTDKTWKLCFKHCYHFTVQAQTSDTARNVVQQNQPPVVRYGWRPEQQAGKPAGSSDGEILPSHSFSWSDFINLSIKNPHAHDEKHKAVTFICSPSLRVCLTHN